MIKSYRGLLASGEQNTINLHTNNGKTGYRIKKFQLMGKDPSESIENLVKVTTIKQTTIDGNVDFNDSTVLAAGMLWASTSQASVHESNIVFENMVFNQDIFITNYDIQTAAAVNYYLELEQVSLTEDQALVAIVKNLRNEQ